MKVLSFIIPSYNSERFLDKCIGSMLCSEVLDALDIIVVNDGSRDGTVEVAQKYCDAYPGSVRLISQENKGHGGALNTGCAAAEGKYLKVIDADDWVLTTNLPQLIDALRELDSDVVLTHYHTVDISTGEVKNWRTYPETFGKSYSFEEIMSQWKSFDRSLTFHGIFYRTGFYRQFGIALSEHVFYEDHEFATFPCCMAKTVTPLDMFLYEYRVGDVQQSVSNENQLKRIGHTETVLRRFAREYHLLPLAADAGGRRYVEKKAEGLLLSYLTTVMLVDPDKKRGRENGAKMMEFFRKEIPGVYAGTKKKYELFRMMNLCHISKQTFEKILHSRIYNRVRNNHDFD